MSRHRKKTAAQLDREIAKALHSCVTLTIDDPCRPWRVTKKAVTL